MLLLAFERLRFELVFGNLKCPVRSIVNAPWYAPNTILHTDLQTPTVKAEITNFSTKYREKLITHPNELIPALLEKRSQED